MMIKCHTWTNSIITLFWILSVYQILILNVESFNLKCPSQAHWKLLANANCNSTLKYYCLYNNVDGKYVEGCNGPDWDRKGCKRIYAGHFTRGDCMQERFQPFKFWTNGSMSDCIYAKSICSEDGQIVYIDDSRKDDRTCRCDYKRNYSFIITPRHLCYCIPTEEDCSCYIKSCPENYTLSADYRCTSSSYQEKPKCISITRYSETVDENTQVDMEKDHSWINDISSEPRWKDTPAALVLYCLCFIYILVVGTFFIAVLFHEWTSKKLQPLKRYIQTKRAGIIITRKWIIEKLWKSGRSQTDDAAAKEIELVDIVDGNNLDSSRTPDDKSQKNGSFKATKELVDVEVHRPLKLAKLTTDGANHLRIIHLLFRVACPVVRMTFNHEIQPDQLRKILDRKKAIMEKKYRKKEKIINNFQWNLLYGPVKGKTVTSDGFDIRLMIYLLGTLANIEVGDLYPVQSDTRVSAMLSRIKFIRNEATQSFEGKLSEDQFNKYWDDIAQAVLKLVSLHGIPDYQEKNQFISRLHTLNPTDLDNDKLHKYIGMSDIYPAKILQRIITEYCESNGQMVEDILIDEKHDMYHKRMITESCCVCSAKDVQFCTFIKVIPEKQWDILYEMKKDTNSHSCPSKLKKCCESFIPKKIDTCDLSVTVPLVLNIPDLLTHMINRLYKNEFDKFLLNNNHAIYHSMEKKRCCKCVKDPTEKILINKKEWNKLFRKEDKVSCQTSLKDCCCQYSVINGIKSSNIDETLLSKIFHVAGPISVLHKSGQAAFLYFLNWTVDEQPLRDALTELLNIIEDKAFKSELSKHMASCSLSQLDETIMKKVDAREWVSRHVKYEKTTPEPPLQIILLDTDGFQVKDVQIPKEFLLPSRTRHFKDLTDEENNFLMVFHVLTKIVYPVIKNEFDRQCTDNVLETIRMDIYEQQTTHCRKDSNKDENKSQKKKVYLTQKQREQLFSPTNEESRNLDLKLMIYILKRISEEKKEKDYFDQLDVIDKIRREIVQNSSGVLKESRFQDILKVINKAILHFGKELYEQTLVNLHHIRNILELL